MRRYRIALAFASIFGFLALGSASSPLGATNYILNGEFDTGLANWTPLLQLPFSNVVWQPYGFDGDFAPAKGSVHIAEARTDGFNYYNGVKQCVNAAGLPGILAFRGYARGEPGSEGSPNSGITTEAIIFYYSAPNCGGSQLPGEVRVGINAQRRWTKFDTSFEVPASAESLLVILVVNKRFKLWGAQAAFDDVYLGTAPAPTLPCHMEDVYPGYEKLCLRTNQFKVTANWRKPDGTTGFGRAVALADESGSFWFFSRANPEMIVKVLNGCGVNNRYWVFAGGLTNVEVTLVVTDTRTGQSKTYTNPLNHTFTPFQDTNAFATCLLAGS